MDHIGRRWRGTFRMVPDALWMHDALQPVDIKVWCALWMHARDSPDVVSTNASRAGSANISLATLKRSLSRLTEVGFVRPEGETTKRVIHLCPDAIEAIYTLRIAN